MATSKSFGTVGYEGQESMHSQANQKQKAVTFPVISRAFRRERRQDNKEKKYLEGYSIVGLSCRLSVAATPKQPNIIGDLTIEWLDRKRDKTKPFFLCSWHKAHRGIRDKRYKLFEFYTQGQWEFYDLQKDPLEMNSEYSNPRYKRTIADMKQELNNLMANYQLIK